MKTHYIYESTGHIANGSIVDEQNHALLKKPNSFISIFLITSGTEVDTRP